MSNSEAHDPDELEKSLRDIDEDDRFKPRYFLVRPDGSVLCTPRLREVFNEKHPALAKALSVTINADGLVRIDDFLVAGTQIGKPTPQTVGFRVLSSGALQVETGAGRVIIAYSANVWKFVEPDHDVEARSPDGG